MKIKVFLALFIVALATACQTPSHPTAQQDENEYWVDTSSADAPTVQAPLEQKSGTVNVYVENSGSMYGYVGVGQASDFRTMVYNYLSDLQLCALFQRMNLYFVNSKVIPQGSAIADFVNKLKPNTFRVAGGSNGTTDIVDIIKMIYPPEGSVAVLVSDCIVSPGRGKNAAEYLDNQQIGLKTFLGEQGNLPGNGVIIYRMIGDFKGKYYNPTNTACNYTGKRPYYVWVIGDVATLKAMRKQVEAKMKTQPDAMCVITTGDNSPQYNIVPGGGRYQLSRTDPGHTISKPKKMKTASGDRVVIKLSADYSHLMQDEAYLTDVANYQVSDPLYRVDNVIKNGQGRYIITLSCPIVKLGAISVCLKNKLPGWVTACSTTSDDCPDPQAVRQTTYGLAYLVGGVYDAYTFGGDNLFEMNITINK